MTTVRTTRSGIEVQSVYNSPQGSGEEAGEFPFTRGWRRHKHSGGSWIQRELSGEGTGAHSNRQLLYLISRGQTGMDVISDSATSLGLDPDHPMSRDSVGTQGVSLCRRQDVLDLLKDIPLDKVSFSCSLPPTTTVAGLMLACDSYGFSPSVIRGSMINAPLYGEPCCYATHFPTDYRVRSTLDVIEYCVKNLPRYHGHIEDTYFFAESGLDGVEEMALGFVQIRYLTRKLVEERGLSVDSFAPRVAILVNCGMDFFEEVAKIRATRRIWAKMMRDEFHAQDPRSLSVIITSHTSGLSLTAQQPTNNIIRGTSQALSLVMAGVQAMEISTFDEAYRTPSPEAHMVGLRTQQIIDLETGVGAVADPLGGSYFVESLTDEMEARILARVAEIEAQGDPADLCDNGYFREIFTNAMERQHREIVKGEVAQVGVNCHKLPAEEDTMLKDVAEQKIPVFSEHIEDVIAWKKRRDMGAVRGSLKRYFDAVKNGTNLVDATMDCMVNDASFGEMRGSARLALGDSWDYYGLEEPVLEV